MIGLGVHRLHEDVVLPKLATSQAACFDIRAFIPSNSHVEVFYPSNQLGFKTSEKDASATGFFLEPLERALVPTGIIMDIPEGYSVRLHPRSGISIKLGLNLVNCEGVIDSDYTHELMIPLINLSSYPVFIEHQMRLCQAELIPILSYAIELCELPPMKGDRSGGFGSTGVK